MIAPCECLTVTEAGLSEAVHRVMEGKTARLTAPAGFPAAFICSLNLIARVVALEVQRSRPQFRLRYPQAISACCGHSTGKP